MPPRDQSKPVRFTLDLPGDLHYRLRMKAIEEGEHASVIVRSLIDRWTRGTTSDALALREAYAAGVRAERHRVLMAVTEASGSTSTGLPTQRPSTSASPHERQQM